MERLSEDVVRLFLVSGDIEEVTSRTFQSAMTASGGGVFAFTGPQPVDQSQSGTDFDRLDGSDIEDVTDLSDGDLVREGNLSDPVDNAQIEGGDLDETDEVAPEDVLNVLRDLGVLDTASNQDIANVALILRSVRNISK